MTQQTINAVRRLVAADTGMEPGEREAWTRALERGILEFAARARVDGARRGSGGMVAVSQAARTLGVCKQTISRMVRDGRLVGAAYRGRTFAVSTASLEPYLTGDLPFPRRGRWRTTGEPVRLGMRRGGRGAMPLRGSSPRQKEATHE